MANENCAITEGLHPEAGVRQPVAMSLKPMGSSSPPPPVTCVCHTESKCRESNDLYFFPPPLLFFSARPVPWLSSLCSFTNTSTSTRLGPPRAVDGDCSMPGKETYLKQFGLESIHCKKGMFKPDRKNFLQPIFSNAFEALRDTRLIISE